MDEMLGMEMAWSGSYSNYEICMPSKILVYYLY
jgi:hypothetical protein